VAEAGGRIGAHTRDFVESWLAFVLDARTARALRDNTRARVLLEQREWYLKKGLARFRNKRALELWGGSSGLRPLDFRWSNALVIGRDIATALGW
jgi:hypothetical protein